MKNNEELYPQDKMKPASEDPVVVDSNDDAGCYDEDDNCGDVFIPEYHFYNPDPYFKLTPLPADHPKHSFWFDEEDHICVRNLSAWWLPEISFEEEIDGTVFNVSASYTGTETLDKKLERIMTEEAKDSLKDGDH